MGIQFVRYGILGNIGRFSPVDALVYPRQSRVVIRSDRGLEVGEVLSGPQSTDAARADGQILRRMSVEDQLLEARLEKHRDAAYLACQSLLSERGIEATLMDVEQLFDGQGVYFYFLGQPPAEAEALTAELAATYEAKVEFRQFADTLEQGCGPGCGTEEAAGQGGCSSCTTCAVAAACGK